ncbi:MAG: hypothetical protein JXJ04_03070 [Spirochaetales bacterium]|nr:hypothetical protein [Spirochaetales bacterium]
MGAACQPAVAELNLIYFIEENTINYVGSFDVSFDKVFVSDRFQDDKEILLAKFSKAAEYLCKARYKDA